MEPCVKPGTKIFVLRERGVASIPVEEFDPKKDHVAERVKLSDWFDPYNKDHIKAYRHLTKFGFWPKPFFEVIPDYVQTEGDPMWQVVLVAKMAEAWVELMLKE